MGSQTRAGVAAVLLIALTTVAVADENPRTTNGWTTQEWPMRGQSPQNLGSMTADFEAPGSASSFRCRVSRDILGSLPGHFTDHQCNVTDFNGNIVYDGAFGAPATEFFSNANAFGIGFGWMFNFHGSWVDAWELQSGTHAGSGPMPCVMGGTPYVFVDGNFADVFGAGWGNCGKLYMAQFRLTPSSKQGSGMNQQNTPASASFQGTLQMDLSDDQRLVPHPICPGAGLLNWFLVDEERKNCRKCVSNLYRIEFNLSARLLRERWRVPLQIGSGLNTPIPKGQEPPPPQEVYFATTAPVVRGDDLLVVGGRRINDDDSLSNDSVLFALDPRTGAQYWTYKMYGRIIEPDPVILDNGVIIFGTDHGRVTALQHIQKSGTAGSGGGGAQPFQDASFTPGQAGSGFTYIVRWETTDTSRLKDHPTPFNTPLAEAEVALYGPAIDKGRRYAYFGGSDGRVHRFQIVNGAIYSSRKLLNYFVGRWSIDFGSGAQGFSSNEFDGSGQPVIRTCAINSPPAIQGNDLLFVKAGTRNMDSSVNESFLFVLNLPDLACNPNLANDAGNLHVVPSKGVFRGRAITNWNGQGTGYNQVSNTTSIFGCNQNFLIPKVFVGYTAVPGTYAWDTSTDVCTVSDPEYGGVCLDSFSFGGTPSGPYIYEWEQQYQTYAVWLLDFRLNGTPLDAGYFLKKSPANDDVPFDLHVDEDIGGVSVAEGFVLATDRGGHVVAIPSSKSPSSNSVPFQGAGASVLPYVTPFTASEATYTNPAPPDGGPARVYPNPFDPDKAVDHVLKVLNMPADARMEIYTLANERVIALSADASYRILWDGHNEAGQPVAAGVYYYKIFFTEPGRPPQTGRLAIVRR